MRARIRPLLQNAALALAAIAVAAVVAEVTLRLFRPQPLEAAYVFPDGTLRHRPSFSYTYTRSGFSNVVTYNSLGFRGPEVARPKQAGLPRILFMGDSFVEGKQVADEEVVTAVLARLLRDGARPAEVINAGVAGAGTGEELILWEKLGRSLAPDLVILGFYPNDVRNNVERRYFAVREGQVVQLREPRLPRVRWIYDARKLLAAHSHLYMLVQSAREAWRERVEEEGRVKAGRGVSEGARADEGRKLEEEGSAAARKGTGEERVATPRGSAGSEADEDGEDPRGAVDDGGEPAGDPARNEDRREPLAAARLLETEDVFEIEPSPEIAAGWVLTEALLTEMKRRVEISGARFMVVALPTRFQVDDALWRAHAREIGISPGLYDLEIPGKRLAAWAEHTGGVVVDLLPAFRAANRDNSFYYAIDAHWNPEGHRIAAGTIHAALVSRGLP